MAIQEHILKAPKAILDTIAKDAERVKAFLRAHKIKLSDTKMQELERDIFRKYESWKKNTQPLRRKLIKYNDMLEGIVEETNSPFEHASNMTTGYPLGVIRNFKSTFNKTMYQDQALFTAVAPPQANIAPDMLKDIEDALNHSFAVGSNGLDALKDATTPCCRDGKIVVVGSWERVIETAHDFKSYSDYRSFLLDYPDSESAGVSEEEYGGIADRFIVDPDFELHVRYDYDFVKFDGVEYELAPLAKFLYWPTFARSIDRMELYGKEYTISEFEVKRHLKSGKFYKDRTEKLLTQKKSSAQDLWDKSREYAEGVRSSLDEYKPIILIDAVYKCDLNDDGVAEKYLLTFAPEQRLLLSMEHYPLRRNIDFCVDAQMDGRESRFLGHSLLGDCEDLFKLIDDIHRHRNNIRLLVASPVFIAQEDYKDSIDLGRAENVIRPGITFWAKDIEKTIKQLPIQNLDQPGNSQDEEQLAKSYIELIFGPTQGQSGMQTPNDPRAPARKTQLLLMQANQRIDDYMDEFRKALPRLAKLHCALLYQYAAGDKISFERNGKIVEVEKKWFANDQIEWQAKRRSVTLTPEFAMARTSGLIQTYSSLYQLIAAGDPIALEMWNRQVRNSGEPDIKKLEKQLPVLSPMTDGTVPMRAPGVGQSQSMPNLGQTQPDLMRA